MATQRPKAAVGLLLLKADKILLGKRLGSHGHGEYAGAGGHLENGETIEQAVRRELSEEAGPDIKIKNLRFLCVINVRAYAPEHYLDVGMAAEWVSGEPKVMEPRKRDAWTWYDLDKLPGPLFFVEPIYIKAHQTGQTFFDG